MATRFNASVAKLQHEMWKNRLITFLNGGAAPSDTSHRDCDLGKWMYSGGLDEYGSYPEMRKLEQRHTDFHNRIKQVIDLQQNGDQSRAWDEYEALKPMSGELGGLLDALQSKVK